MKPQCRDLVRGLVISLKSNMEEKVIDTILKSFPSISLSEMEGVRLMNRIDTKYDNVGAIGLFPSPVAKGLLYTGNKR